MKKLFILLGLLLALQANGQLAGIIGQGISGASGFPQVLAGTETGSETVNTLSHPITMPTGTQAAELIAVCFATDGVETITINTVASGLNWTIENFASQGSIITGAIVWKIAEGGDALTLTTGSLEMASFISYRISGFKIADPMTVTNNNGDGANADPPENTGVDGAVNYLWIAFAGWDASADVVATAAPTDFGNLEVLHAASSNGTGLSTARREYNFGAAYNPGVFTSDAEQWVAFTIIINPIFVSEGKITSGP